MHDAIRLGEGEGKAVEMDDQDFRQSVQQPSNAGFRCAAAMVAEKIGVDVFVNIGLF